MTLFNSKNNYVVKKIYQTILYSSFTKFFSDFYIQIDKVLNSSVKVFCYLLVFFFNSSYSVLLCNMDSL